MYIYIYIYIYLHVYIYIYLHVYIYMGLFFHKISGSQEDNQASILDCPHLVFGRQGREDA